RSHPTPTPPPPTRPSSDLDISHADVTAAREAIARNRDIIVGVKARLSNNVAGNNDYEVLRRAQEVASSFNLPVMIHMGQTISPLDRKSTRLNSSHVSISYA